MKSLRSTTVRPGESSFSLERVFPTCQLAYRKHFKFAYRHEFRTRVLPWKTGVFAHATLTGAFTAGHLARTLGRQAGHLANADWHPTREDRQCIRVGKTLMFFSRQLSTDVYCASFFSFGCLVCGLEFNSVSWNRHGMTTGGALKYSNNSNQDFRKKSCEDPNDPEDAKVCQGRC